MKRLLLSALFIASALNTFSQEERHDQKADTNEAGVYYGKSSQVAVSDKKQQTLIFRRAFKVNSATNQAEVYDRALGFARLFATDYREDKKKAKITIPVSWKYYGGSNDCIENLNLQAQLVVEVKDLKTRISLINITYQHHSGEKSKPVAKSNFFSREPECAPAEGKAELLFNCSACDRSIQSIEKHFSMQFESYASLYQERLKKY